MKISPEEVAKVARLARLDLPADKVELFAGQLGDILAYMDKLGELDTADVEPMYSPVKHTTVLRKDEVRKDYAREEILANAPERDGQFFIVPRIV
ncbi:Asp-tRNA(Asn)/Glu-tRNA(Gln) amidotransferase subunit GatC [Pseudodesulfovibrio sp.]|uniref:Asp-tRNA(Asn)/Glu-tRNA(Gln) amidotransferase subunit GatC n=1 Tax=Pseudodesulfovibrio sp. TaxID=2035812 RepID=UPI002614A1ED|nr:Asp-tRNA(Asn)/Glu-tRNA(Gln) amidotransferase subunit GatC [Pseudodesulfovibrio sp.]MDD3312829.1 Asp-tRNA(Asn)/Glu-tRNA(Gln) amidotransferase subunit GatC [Pseudodesulfovibrio sp.]